MMKVIIGLLVLIMFIAGCKDSLSKNNAYLMSNKAHKAKQLSDNSIKLATINNNAKVNIAKIKSANNIALAKLKAASMKNLAQIHAATAIKTATINIAQQKQTMKIKTYIFMAVTLVTLVALYVYYLVSQRNRELRAKMHEEKLKHDLELKEREYFEKRLHKMIDLAADGKLPADMQQEVIHSLQHQNQKLIDAKLAQ